MRIFNWASTADAESVAIYHAIQKSSERQRHLAVCSDSQGALYRPTAFSPENMLVINILDQISSLSEQGIRAIMLDTLSYRNIKL